MSEARHTSAGRKKGVTWVSDSSKVRRKGEGKFRSERGGVENEQKVKHHKVRGGFWGENIGGG